MMVDRDGRNRLAECIRHLAAGVLTNRQFEATAEFDSADPAIRAVFWGGPWFLYDDFSNYRLRGGYRLTPAVRREAARWVLFLKTDLPYEWPIVRRSILGDAIWLLTNVATVGHVARVAQCRFQKYGDISVWPFIHRSDYEAALGNPPYLSRPSNGGVQPPPAAGRG
jgi:hypothetical protein